MINSDTICAISTPAGVGGIAVLRLSGSDARRMAEQSLLTPSGASVTLADRRARLAHLVTSDGFLDEVVATLFPAKGSYTGDDVVEISCHGSMYIQRQALQHFVNQGARIAEPGEFTLRAFLNGRLNLSQAEAVADLIDSQSQSAHSLAVSQMRGGYAAELERLRQSLVDTTALMELELDFSDEDLEFVNRQRLRDMVNDLTVAVSRLVDTFSTGNALKNGVPVAIVGRPNVGKSTLLNAILNDERAIVSDIAGTTRDTIEEQFVVDGIMFRLIDTAGIRHSDDAVEREGIARSLSAMRRASIILYMVDAADTADSIREQLDNVKKEIDLENKHIILLRNKIDIDNAPFADVAIEGDVRCVDISAKRGDNIDSLLGILVEKTGGLCSDRVLLTNVRHFEAMKRVLSALDEVRKGLDVGLTPDLLVIDMRDALYHLGTITGKVTSDEVLSSIFSRFCIGK